ncbi:CRISPR-associated protein Csx10 [Caldanaerovirga acetigignens]|uniref:CRISPR-associated protein Csx10 n=1 Tax=Caldanaerovirga acetigignens TaxID=447595 RepID=A0A1M7MMI4_9FIRM|nr:CRISPR-associated RAMP protein Csx10 [Caldanaerovirga acetigignens]SHM92249.1 CRISPR-associated protein Csx10 [Caldanaerovirga acetigignens]
MKVISYRITLLEPALLTALEGDPNESVSFNYIPGSVLRGAVIGKYMRSRKLKTLDAGEETVRRLFFDGTTRFLNGYPLDRLENRTLPVPLSWQQDKKAASIQTDGDPAPIYDFAIDEHPKDIDQPQGLRAPFCTLYEDMVRLVSPERQLSIHTARNRRYGRAIPQSSNVAEEPSGAVYRYEALAGGQSFEALILCDCDEDAELLRLLLAGEVFLGGSRSAGYGRAKIHNVDIKTAAEDWREVDRELVAQVDGKLIVTFLSDVLLRDENGQFTADPGAVTATLEKKLGMKLKFKRAFIRSELIGGFNRKWGLPLPQVLAIKMGSVFVYELSDDSSYDMAKLLDLEAKGIGERRAEGFGRLAFNWLTEEMLEVEPKVSPKAVLQTISEEESKTIAERMVARMLERRLEGKLVARAVEVADFLVGNRELPSNAQVSRLRGIIRYELMKENPDPQRVKDFLKDIETRKPARKQFEKVRVGERSLLEWMRDTLNEVNPDNWKQLFGISRHDIPKLGGVEPKINESFRIRYILRYIDAVLACALEKKRGKEGN